MKDVEFSTNQPENQASLIQYNQQTYLPQIPDFNGSVDLLENLKKCLLFLSVIPSNFEFEKKEVVDWLIDCLCPDATPNGIDFGMLFDALVFLSFFQISDLDRSRYKLGSYGWDYLDKRMYKWMLNVVSHKPPIEFRSYSSSFHMPNSLISPNPPSSPCSVMSPPSSPRSVIPQSGINLWRLLNFQRCSIYGVLRLLKFDQIRPFRVLNLTWNPLNQIPDFKKIHVLNLSGVPQVNKIPVDVVHIPYHSMQSHQDVKTITYDEVETLSNLGEVTSPYGFDTLSKRILKCLFYTSLFQKNYEFKKDELIQMWIAVGYISSQEEYQLLEDTAADYFRRLLFDSSFQVSNLDETKYTLQDDTYTTVQDLAGDEYVSLSENNVGGISESTRHLSVVDDSVIIPSTTKFYDRLKGLHSLLLLHEKRRKIKEIPSDLILSLRCVRLLVFSGTQLQELPSSIGELKNLCYLDLSETPLKRLPQSITKLSNLQTLKLINCLNFVELPKNFKNLINLRHLDLDIIRQLTFLPPKIGRLVNLQTFSAFLVGRKEGCQIAELKQMNCIRGSLHICKLENILTKDDAKEAALRDKDYLYRLELHWGRSCLNAMDILEGLEPPRNLIEIEIACYGGSMFPTWLGDSSFSKLTDLFIYKCRNCTVFPSLGQLPSLKSLQIQEMQVLKEINQQFCLAKEQIGFPKLETLVFNCMPSLEEWIGVEETAMPNLKKLSLIDCPNLVRLPELSILKSLEDLRVSLCFKLNSLSENKLADTLQTLIITDCPKMKESYQKEGIGWHKIVDTATIWIDYQQIS